MALKRKRKPLKKTKKSVKAREGKPEAKKVLIAVIAAFAAAFCALMAAGTVSILKNMKENMYKPAITEKVVPVREAAAPA